MPRKSTEELVRRNIKRLISYAENNLELETYDSIYVENELLHMFSVTEPYCGDLGEFELYAVLGELFSVAVKRKMYSPEDRLLFEGRIMGTLMPRPITVVERFDRLAARRGSMVAAKWLQQLEEKATYLRRPDLDKNIKWQHQNSERGDITITINLAKPEKTKEEVERAKNAKTGYPKCVLCPENIGHYGNAGQPARQHIRLIPFELDEEEWFMQFSPYEYFSEHIIAVSKEHRPMSLNAGSFRRMAEFIESTILQKASLTAMCILLIGTIQLSALKANPKSKQLSLQKNSAVRGIITPMKKWASLQKQQTNTTQ